MNARKAVENRGTRLLLLRFSIISLEVEILFTEKTSETIVRENDSIRCFMRPETLME